MRGWDNMSTAITRVPTNQPTGPSYNHAYDAMTAYNQRSIRDRINEVIFGTSTAHALAKTDKYRLTHFAASWCKTRYTLFSATCHDKTIEIAFRA